ncbi:MAG: SufD family Fe-S cluster assembly protein [Sphingomonas sp.]
MGWANRLTQIALGTGARLMRSVRLLQSEGFVSIRDEAEVGEAASLVSVFLGAGGMGSRIDGAIALTGKGAFAEMGGALLTRASRKQEAAVVVRHAAPEGTSRQVWRAVAADSSTASLRRASRWPATRRRPTASSRCAGCCSSARRRST